MKSTIWKAKREELESFEEALVQVEVTCEKLKKETDAQNENIRKMLQEISDQYYS